MRGWIFKANHTSRHRIPLRDTPSTRYVSLGKIISHNYKHPTKRSVHTQHNTTRSTRRATPRTTQRPSQRRKIGRTDGAIATTPAKRHQNKRAYIPRSTSPLKAKQKRHHKNTLEQHKRHKANKLIGKKYGTATSCIRTSATPSAPGKTDASQGLLQTKRHHWLIDTSLPILA